ncbi:hypothetical protein OIU79_003151 [Salix purpurea]|uniref:Uncharacterized protein n=1 Tax=Salix purpurea TaxID=77065 RepID=A0A9Q0UKS2_SALPP|nr:hypothetical protein OIU79_003151 [Salix purpurea]
MGICWSSLPDQKPNSLPIVPSTIDNLSAGDTCSVGDNSWLSVGSSNLTTWVSQVSGSFTRVWGKNNGTHEGSRYLDAGSDGDFENCGIRPWIDTSSQPSYKIGRFETPGQT